MNDLQKEKLVYELLKDVFLQKAYCSLALDKALNTSFLDSSGRGYVTKLFYGVLDYNIQFDFIIEKLCPTTPKAAVKILLKIGLYLLKYMDVPDYAAINKTVELSKLAGKGGVSGFINAVLKKSISIELPADNSVKSLSVRASYPLWLAELLIKDYGYEFTEKFLQHKNCVDTHIRNNGFKISKVDFEAKYGKLLQNLSSLGYYATHNTLNQINKADYIIQSLASMLAVQSYFDIKAKKVLDVCAAPGGKSVYLKQLYNERGIDAQIIACDIHSHRVELIKKYAENAGCKITTLERDATIFNSDFESSFDLVICDVPCSGIGVVGSKPDILLNKSPEGIKNLADIQLRILNNSAKYVANNGSLCYSTCTVIKEENEGVINKFLANNSDFKIEKICNDFVSSDYNGFVKLFPHINGCDGFFVCKLRKIEKGTGE